MTYKMARYLCFVQKRVANQDNCDAIKQNESELEKNKYLVFN